MNYLQRFFLFVFSFLSLSMFFSPELAYSSFSAYENQISEESSESKVIKLQRLFLWLWLYNWEINGNFEDIKDELLDYQIKSWIITNYDDYGAWYFWVKTIEALESEYWDKFINLREEFLKMDKPEDGERYFYVTAYYSPIPGQERYSYSSSLWRYRTYEEAKKMQWNGTHWASWKPVFEWMLAWPRNYVFGTKLYLEWIGIWEIADRWWAIVNAWERGFEYDRIDVWMWYGDEWRIRAEKWWMRKVKWYIVDDTDENTLEFEESPVAKYKDLIVDAENPEIESVKNLQLLLKDVDLYSWDIDWDFDKVRNILINFQVDNWVIESEYDPVAGYFGSKTYVAFRKKFGDGIFVEKYIEPGYNIALSKVNKHKMRLLKNKLEWALDKKYNWNQDKINADKQKLKKVLNKLIEKSTKITQKNKLRYLEAIL